MCIYCMRHDIGSEGVRQAPVHVQDASVHVVLHEEPRRRQEVVVTRIAQHWRTRWTGLGEQCVSLADTNKAHN